MAGKITISKIKEPPEITFNNILVKRYDTSAIETLTFKIENCNAKNYSVFITIGNEDRRDITSYINKEDNTCKYKMIGLNFNTKYSFYLLIKINGKVFLSNINSFRTGGRGSNGETN